MFDKLDKTEAVYNRLSEELSKENIDYSSKSYLESLKKHKALERTVLLYRQYKDVKKNIEEAKELLSDSKDSELISLAKEELNELFTKEADLVSELKISLFPKDPNNDKNVIMEIRAGTGGDEAALFAADLYRMYFKYSENSNWKIEILSSSPTEVGGYKEIIFSVSGKDVYSKLKFEMGGHRVQRIPVTESGGRIHTSAVTVAVLPEVEEEEIEINPSDLRVDVFRSSGPGGQSVNTTDSAVRITHIPSGITVQCQDEKSQHKNKSKAMRVLRARIQERLEEERKNELKEERKLQIGSGDRSQRIRTYNFPQNRMTDHRVNFSVYNKLDNLLNGEIEEFINKMVQSEKEEILKNNSH